MMGFVIEEAEHEPNLFLTGRMACGWPEEGTESFATGCTSLTYSFVSIPKTK